MKVARASNSVVEYLRSEVDVSFARGLPRASARTM